MTTVLERSESLAQLARDLRLTKAQRTFAMGLAEGLTQRDAALRAGSKRPDEAGSRWARLSKVKDYAAQVAKLARASGDQGIAAQLQQVVENVQVADAQEVAQAENEIMTAAEVQRELTTIGRAQLPEQVPPRVKLGALEALARIHGLDKSAAEAGATSITVERLLVVIGGQPGKLGETAKALLSGETV